MKRIVLQSVVASLALAGLCCVGCGGGGAGVEGAATYAVTGTVTMDGRPVDGATVVFSPSAKDGEAAIGITDANGKYALRSPGGRDGAVPGSYAVTVSKSESAGSTAGGSSSAGSSGDDSLGLDDSYPSDYNGASESGESGGGTKSVNFLPAKYADAGSSGLSATVTEDAGKNVFDFALKK